MPNPGLDFNNTPDILVGASTAKVGAASPANSNPALQLGAALQDLNPKLTGALAAVASEDQKVQSAAARKRAIELGGKSLSEAVKAGQIEPTQNPYFIQDYNREAAAVSTQAAFDKLNTEAAEWAEKNDPDAFRKRYTEATQEIGKGYQDVDAQEGFRAIAAQNAQQALSANVAYNVGRITQERQENLSALVAKTIIETNAKFAGKASGSQVDAAIEPLRNQWLSTGGNAATWNKVALQGVLAASFNTHSKSILDAAKTMANHVGGGSLYDTLGSAEQIETARYRIESDERDKRRLESMERQERIFRESLAAQGTLFQMFGPRLYTGQVSPDEMTQAANTLGTKFPAAAVATAFGDAARITNSIREVNNNRAAFYEQSGAGAAHVATLYGEAAHRGWSPELQNDLGKLLLQGNISEATSREISDKAFATTNRLAQVGGIGAAAPALVARNAAKIIKQWTDTRQAITADVANRFTSALRAGHDVSPALHQAGQDAAIQAAATHLDLHPGDFKGAQAAAVAAFKSWASRLPQ